MSLGKTPDAYIPITEPSNLPSWWSSMAKDLPYISSFVLVCYTDVKHVTFCTYEEAWLVRQKDNFLKWTLSFVFKRCLRFYDIDCCSFLKKICRSVTQNSQLFFCGNVAMSMYRYDFFQVFLFNSHLKGETKQSFKYLRLIGCLSFVIFTSNSYGALLGHCKFFQKECVKSYKRLPLIVVSMHSFSARH